MLVYLGSLGNLFILRMLAHRPLFAKEVKALLLRNKNAPTFLVTGMPSSELCGYAIGKHIQNTLDLLQHESMIRPNRDGKYRITRNGRVVLKSFLTNLELQDAAAPSLIDSALVAVFSEIKMPKKTCEFDHKHTCALSTHNSCRRDSCNAWV